jgi:polyribonucleotide nucleotidyltransferase
MSEVFSVPFGPSELQFEIGKVAKQAHGAVWGTWGDTVVLAACVTGPNYRNTDFFPLMVDYRDKMYGDGRIPGSFFRREGRPSDHEVLKARMIDRPLRPMFPKEFMDEVQVYLNTYSVDQEHVDFLISLNAASCALLISPMPFTTAVSAVRIGRIDSQLIVNPTVSQMDESDLDLVVAGTAEAITMVEAGADLIEESVMLEALALAHENIQRVCAFQEEIRAKIGKPKDEFVPAEVDQAVADQTAKLAAEELKPLSEVFDKAERAEKVSQAREKVLEAMHENLGEEQFEEHSSLIRSVFDDVYKKNVRAQTLAGKRTDGRVHDEIRPISVEVSVLPRTHGSALFTRGQTQALGTCTLGTRDDQFLVDDIRGV